MSILVFSDVHLGIKTHSIQDVDGLATAENEARIALGVIYERAKQDDIDLIICCGDVFHTSHPTTKNIEFFIGWLKQMDALGKPFNIITGNHDGGVYSSSLTFMNTLELKNVGLIDTLHPAPESIWCRQWQDWDIYFVPHVTGYTSKDKEGPVYATIEKIIGIIEDKPSIIVTHVYDSDVTVGSEATMISRYTETIDFDETAGKNIVLLLGHAHKHQTYVKEKTGMQVLYPGSIFYHDLWDVNQEKGYMIFNPDGTFTFEQIDGIREFILYNIPEGRDAVELFNTVRLSSGKHIFLSAHPGDVVDESALRVILESKGCSLGGIRYQSAEASTAADILVNDGNVDNYGLFEGYLKALLKSRNESDNFNMIAELGTKYLERNTIKKEV